MQSTRLPNGVRVVSESLTDLASVTAGIWVENGSRYETPEQAGISHFLEHLFFKGTERRTAAGIAEEMDAVGGVLNAFTGKEYTCYYAKVLREHLPMALDLLADIFTHSTFPSEEVERERSVVIQEISQAEDTPDDYVHELFNTAFWPGHPLARPIAGTPATVSALNRDHFLAFLDARYRPDRILITAAGNVTHEQLLAVAEQHFGGLAGTAVPVDGVPPTHRPGVSIHDKDLEQVHVCLGTPGISHTDGERYAAHLLNMALGGGMSSRLFQEIRERRGKAYTVYSFLSSYFDAGYVGTYVGTSPQWVREVVEIIRSEQRRTTREGLAAAELVRVKNQMKGSMLLGLETSDSRMSRIAKNMIYFGRDVPLEEVAASIDRVTNDDIVRVAQRVFPAGAFGLTVLGDMKGHAVGDEVLRE
jgi:predicted Zn-dependent peptidase